jgi:UTP--glucose-1-phosphate uridylyltransferase
MPPDVATRFRPFEARMRAENVPALAIETFRHYYAQLAEGATGLLTEPDIGPVEHVADAEDAAGLRDAGLAALARTVVIKLNGGLGTSMGLTKAKSLLPAKAGRTFLDLIAEQVLHWRVTHGVRLPLLLMNSFRTRQDSLGALAPYGDLSGDLPSDFLQHKVPKVRAGDLTPAEWPRDPAHEWCPPGHGDLYTALSTSGLLDALLDRGFVHAFVSNSDNLGAVVDPSILGYFAERKLPFLMEVCDRTEADKKGGHLARREDGGLVLREIAQCPPGEIARFQDVARFRFFNTNTLWVDLEALRGVLDARRGILGLPLIVNEKPVDPADESSPRVFQLETAMGAAISVFEGAEAIRVPRERFIPVKTTNDLLALWSDLYVLGADRRLVPAAGRRAGDIVVDLDPRHFRRIEQLEQRFPSGAPSLRECRRLVVRGDVRFGAGCVCRGDVTIAHEGAPLLAIADGEVLR